MALLSALTPVHQTATAIRPKSVLDTVQTGLMQAVHMQAMLLLFELTTMDNWPTVMHVGMDAAGVGVQPVTNRSSSFSLFFVVFICVSAFFLTRAFIGAFIKQVGSL